MFKLRIITDMLNDDLINVYIVKCNVYKFKYLYQTTKLYIINKPDMYYTL